MLASGDTTGQRVAGGKHRKQQDDVHGQELSCRLAPMNWLGDWANLLLRWTHFIAGIAWIGSSFYFIWLDRTLTAPAIARPGVEGDHWMVHSGGFYQVEKRRQIGRAHV